MRQFIYSLMTDKREEPVFKPLKWLLYLASRLYGAGIWLRALLYKFGIFKRHRVPMNVISVGNITLGGTGKTPFVIALAKILKDEMKKEVSVLIRGYGWDEQAMLRTSLPAIPILVGEDRVKAARRTIKVNGSDAAILDDGFQYWELERDLDIILIDSRNPFGNGQLFPRGILREPKDSARRADIAVFTKINKRLCDIDTIRGELKKIKEDIIFLEALHKPKEIYEMRTKKTLDLTYARDKRVILFSSIGDPEYFEETVRDMGSNIIMHIKFPDHHNYTKTDIENIAKACGGRNFDILLTTEKDSVKLNRLGLSIADYTVAVLSVEMEISSGRETIVARLHSLYNN